MTCRYKTCIVLDQVGVSFDLYYDARKHKIKIQVYLICFIIITLQLPCKKPGMCGRYSDHTAGWDDLGEESGRVRDLPLLENVQNGCGTNHSFCSIGNGILYGGLAPGALR